MGRQGAGPHLAEDVIKIPYQVTKAEIILEMHPPPGLKLKPNSSGAWGSSNLELPGPHVAPSSSSSSFSSRVIPPKRISVALRSRKAEKAPKEVKEAHPVLGFEPHLRPIHTGRKAYITLSFDYLTNSYWLPMCQVFFQALGIERGQVLAFPKFTFW